MQKAGFLIMRLILYPLFWQEYLQSLYLEKIESERHKIFLTGSVKQKARLKHQGYGPIDDETQVIRDCSSNNLSEGRGASESD